jgi:hypothetical protein
MASPLGHVAIRTGTSPPETFSRSGTNGDWQTFGIPFNPPFPPAAAGKIRVLATACRPAGGGPAARALPATPVAGEISPVGCAIWARNSDIVGGEAGFNWIAVAEVADAAPTAMTAVMGLISPSLFATAAQVGDWSSYTVPIPANRADSAPPAVVASGSNANVRVHACAAIAVADNQATSATEVSFRARNSDVGPGLASFHYVGFVPSDPAPELVVDTGRVAPLHFAVGARPGDWQAATVNFNDYFLAPPIVVITADNYDALLPADSVAAVPMANDVTPYGFTLAARNSDIRSGWVAFSWMAIGHGA